MSIFGEVFVSSSVTDVGYNITIIFIIIIIITIKFLGYIFNILLVFIFR
jgi:hypothetical protein